MISPSRPTFSDAKVLKNEKYRKIQEKQQQRKLPSLAHMFLVCFVQFYCQFSLLLMSFFSNSSLHCVLVSFQFIYSWLVRKPLAFCIKLRRFLPNIDHSFSIKSLCGIALKIAVVVLFIFYTSFYFLAFIWSTVGVILLCIPEIRAPKICVIPTESSMLAIKLVSSIMTLKYFLWVPSLLFNI